MVYLLSSTKGAQLATNYSLGNVCLIFYVQQVVKLKYDLRQP
ncbi:hypothetical protein [Pontibacter fetidus]|nr:hypothetical protein [Pontibacter fetidus]